MFSLILTVVYNKLLIRFFFYILYINMWKELKIIWLYKLFRYREIGIVLCYLYGWELLEIGKSKRED